METGIYTITSPSGRFYVGSAATSFTKRWAVHKHHLRKQTHSNPHLQHAWDKYGEENIVFAVYLRCEPHECLALEQIAIDTMLPEYNISKNVTLSFLGLKHKPESLKKMSASKKGQGLGRKMPESQRELLRSINTGRVHTPEACAKISKSKQGITLNLSDAQRAALVARLTGRENTPETILKMSESAKNRSPEWGKKLSARQMGKDNPMYGRTGDKSPRFGAKVSPEICAMLSAAAKLRTGENSQNGRPVLCVELNRIFATAGLATDWLREQGLTTSKAGHIGAVCAGKRPIAYGFHWKYPDQPTVDNPATAP
jgi:group I intron endonuclease